MAEEDKDESPLIMAEIYKKKPLRRSYGSTINGRKNTKGAARLHKGIDTHDVRIKNFFAFLLCVFCVFVAVLNIL